MAIDFFNACAVCSVIAVIVACVTEHEDTVVLAWLAIISVGVRAVIWMQDNFKSGGLTMEGKWYLSITFWLNILTVIVAVAVKLFGFGDLEPAPLGVGGHGPVRELRQVQVLEEQRRLSAGRHYFRPQHPDHCDRDGRTQQLRRQFF